eukprot:920929_1
MSATMQQINLRATVLAIIISLSTSILEPLVWIEPSSPLLLRETCYNVPAYHDGSIWLVGGVSNIHNTDDMQYYRYTNLMSYNITNNSFTLHPNLSQAIVSHNSQNWAQIDDTLYIHVYNYWIGTFNLTSKSYVDNKIRIPNATIYEPCITDFNGSYLILLGGNINYYNQMQIFDLTADQWISDGPPMKGFGRRFFTCNSINGFLYAIGGQNKFGSIYDTVIMLDIDNIFNITNTWIQLTDTLSIGRQYLRSVVYHDLIFVLGGMDKQYEIQDNVDVINTTTNTISFNSNLSKPLSAIAAIVADDTLFVLSGAPLSNQWQYALLLSQSTTSEPSTSEPTTHNPTTYNPTTSEPTTYNPTTPEPTTYNPTTYKPTTYNPTTPEPTTYNPTTYKPTTHNPTTYNPTTSEPTTYNPTTPEPTTYNPTTYNPTTSLIPTTTTTETPTTTSIERNCDCTGGMVELTVQYIGECDAHITTYYDIKILPNCVFNNVISGDCITCTAPVGNGKFENKLYFDIDCVDYRRRSQEKKHAKESDEHDKYCTAKLDTSCESNIIGEQSKWCGDLKVISYVSGDGSICNKIVIHNNEHAVINDERTNIH